MDNLEKYIAETGAKAKLASKKMKGSSLFARNQTLVSISAELLRFKDKILEANLEDLKHNKDLSSSMTDRLKLTSSVVDAVAEGIINVSSLA